MYDAGGAPLLRFGGRGRDEGQLDFPTGIAVAPQTGHVLVSDQRNSRLQFFDADGGFLACVEVRSASRCGFDFFCNARRQYDQGIALDVDGRIYVADAFEGTVQVMDGSGRPLGTIGLHGAAPGQLRAPMDVAIDAFGRLFVSSPANGRLESFALDPAAADPERFVPALVQAPPDPIEVRSGAEVTLQVEVPGYRLSDVAGLGANGAAPLAVESGDADRDARPELTARFALAALGGGPSAGDTLEVLLDGSVGGLDLDGRALLDLLQVAPPDADEDGVDDAADACLGTTPGAQVDGRGCSLAQACPCRGPLAGGSWRRPGEQRRCVTALFRDLRPQRPRTAADRADFRALVSELRQALCRRAAR